MSDVTLATMPTETVLGRVANGNGRPPATSLIDMRDLWKTYEMGSEQVHALHGVSFDVKKGEYIAIMPLIYGGIGSAKRHEMAKQALAAVDLADRVTHRPNELSGGQRQRVAIARALVNNPSILLADEPTGALDTHTSMEIMDLFERLHEEGNTVVLVTHERDIAARAHRIISIRDGQIEKDEIVR